MSTNRIHIFREIVIVLVLSPVFVSSISIKTVNAQAGQVTLKPSDDTYVDSSNPNSNYGGQTTLDIEYVAIDSLATFQDLVWLKFDLSSVPNGAVVDIASIQLYTSYVTGTFNVHDYSCSNNSWTELSLMYSNMPSYNTTSMDSVLVASSNQWYNWSVIDAVRNALNGNPKSVTIIIQEPTPQSSGTSIGFKSKESPVYLTDYSPKLTIHWSSIVPEFQSFLLLALFMITMLIAVAFYKKKTMQNKRL